MLHVYDIVKICGGSILCGDENIELINFSKDTRTIKDGDVYVGIRGEVFDGNSFYRDAFDKGASVCILDNIDINDIPDLYKEKTIVKVDDSILCLQKLASYKRSLIDKPVIAITGSVGKTSTKDMVSSVLSQKYRVLKTEGNNNNHIGVPLTILRYKDEDVLVVEMGMNNKGELSVLTNIAKPTIGVITNVGTAHIGNLGSRENILKAKLEITEGLNGPLIVNNDNDMIHNHLSEIEKINTVVTVGINNKSDYMASSINDSLTNFAINGTNINCMIGNTAFIYNSLVSYAVGSICNIDANLISRGIECFKLTENRLEKKVMKNRAILIDDTYNASLDSIKSSLEILKKEPGKRRIAVIGDILELGKYSEDIHIEVGRELLKCNLDIIVTIGSETEYTDKYLRENGFNSLYHFANEKESEEFIKSLLKEGDIVLLKGSHGINLKNVVLYLLKD